MERDVYQELLACGGVADMKRLVIEEAAVSKLQKISRCDIDKFSELAKAADHRSLLAFGMSLALKDACDLVKKLRRSGCLRASRRGFRSAGLEELVCALVELKHVLSIPNKQVEYLRSVANLYTLSGQARAMQGALVRRLSSRRGVALKTHLALLDHYFSQPHEYDFEASTEDLSHYCIEDLAEGVSRLIALHREVLGLGAMDMGLTDDQGLDELNTTYKRDLLDALHLEAVIRAEVLLDGLPYEATVAGNDVIVRSIDADFEKSTRFGYVQTTAQVNVRHQRMFELWGDSEPAALKDVIEAYGVALADCTRLIERPIERIAFSIPNIPGAFDALSADCIYLEEFLMLLQLDVERYGEQDELVFEVGHGVTSLDLFKVMRFFSLIEHVFARCIDKQSEHSRDRLKLDSAVLVVNHERLVHMISRVVNDARAKKVVEFLTLSPEEHVDLQYKPLMRLDGLYFLSPAIIANSNLVRNVVRANRLKDLRSEGRDDMQDAVTVALLAAGFLVAKEVGGTKSNAMPEFDIVAWRQGELYLFECKSSYHPVNPHEVRNSFDHISEAAKQLSVRASWLSNAQNMHVLWKTVGWPALESKPVSAKVRTCVVMANRVLAGIEVGGHPVRQAHELISVLTRGFIEGPGIRLRFWRAEQFSNADLNEYLGSTGLVADHFAAMLPIATRTRIGGKTLVNESYVYSPDKEAEIFKSRYADVSSR